MFIGLEFGRQAQVAGLHAKGCEHVVRTGAVAGAGVAHVEALALEVGQRLGLQLLAHHHGHGLWMHGEHGTQLG
ncbi:hypothetical protein D3C79_965510 [compost metagenome]